MKFTLRKEEGGAGEEGTKKLVKKYKKDTPGQNDSDNIKEESTMKSFKSYMSEAKDEDFLNKMNPEPTAKEMDAALKDKEYEKKLDAIRAKKKKKNESVELDEKSAAWQRKAGKNKEGGLNAAGRKSYERENPGSDLKAPVSAAQAKRSKGGKAAKRRKSFCARMGGMPGPMKDEKGRPTRKALALRKWDC